MDYNTRLILFCRCGGDDGGGGGDDDDDDDDDDDCDDCDVCNHVCDDVCDGEGVGDGMMTLIMRFIMFTAMIIATSISSIVSMTMFLRGGGSKVGAGTGKPYGALGSTREDSEVLGVTRLPTLLSPLLSLTTFKLSLLSTIAAVFTPITALLHYCYYYCVYHHYEDIVVA